MAPRHSNKSHHVKTSILFRTELFMRQYFIPFNISQRIAVNSETTPEAVEDLYKDIQKRVDILPFMTNDTDFCFQDTKNLYLYLFQSSKGLAHILNEPTKFYEEFCDRFMELPTRVVAIYRKHRALILKRKRCKKSLPQPNPGIIRVPNFLLTATCDELLNCCDHFYQYFRVFCGRSETGVEFHYDFELPVLEIHLRALRSDFNVSVLTVIAESVKKCSSADDRSVFYSKSHDGGLHAFGPGSYISHGCGKHNSVALPNLGLSNRYCHLQCFSQCLTLASKQVLSLPTSVLHAKTYCVWSVCNSRTLCT
jgi:hypothetical protein